MSYQGHNFLRHEQYMGQGQSHKCDNREGKRTHSGISNPTIRN